jgi:DNA replication regulator SLD3
MKDLVEFLKSLVMSTVIIDKKYRNMIPEIVSKMKTLVEDSENGEPASKKRKPKKMKLDKNGLYPGEESHVRSWWTSRKPSEVDSVERSVTGQEISYHISCLRRRETQLQMILILEILALELLCQGDESPDGGQLPGMDSATTVPTDTASKKRSKHNLPVLLDVHADRLCIWQSTTLDEVKALAESQPASHADKSDRQNSDPLRDFCVEIILPL